MKYNSPLSANIKIISPIHENVKADNNTFFVENPSENKTANPKKGSKKGSLSEHLIKAILPEISTHKKS